MKTLFSIFFSILVIIISWPYPFTTSRTLLFEWFVIGIPSFILAFLPNNKPIEGKFIYNLIKNALPGAIALVLNIAGVYLFSLFTNGSVAGTPEIAECVQTMSTLVLTFTGLAMLYRLCKPFSPLTVTLFVVMFVLALVCVFVWPEFFGLVAIGKLGITNILFVIVLSFAAPTVIHVLYKIMDKVKL